LSIKSRYLVVLILLLAVSLTAAEGGRLLVPKSLDKAPVDEERPLVFHSGFNSLPSPRNILDLDREKPWALPKASTLPEGVDTLWILALRYDFQYETTDDPNTTGRGRYDLRTFEEFTAEYGHEADPAPHDKAYFETHLKALREYYRFVSKGKLHLEYEVFPRQSDSVYHLPHPMAYYGEPIPNIGLANYFIDCIQLVDTAVMEVIFGDYDSYFLIHAGSDRQNDIGFPPTPHDLFTGYIFLIDTFLTVDKQGDDSNLVMDAMIIPEMGSQDNRAVALNAVIAHEFGHQLGLIDLYATSNFFSRVGDFALMDNNGFGTGIDFGFSAGNVFGAFPIYPMAWSRAYLGFDVPVVYRQGADIPLVAAEMMQSGTRIAKIPISEYEYYLLENRQESITTSETAVLADSITSVFIGPSDLARNLTGEYDILMPGSGMLIWRVDEEVAYLDYDNNGRNNYFDNHLQNDPDRPFVELLEADGLVNFGGDYFSGYGRQEDMYYAGNNSSLTPNTNPPAFGYGKTNTHIYITDISESDLTMTFDVERDWVSDGFPARAGVPFFNLSPIAADLDMDGSVEIINASGRNIIAINDDGSDFTPNPTPFLDTAVILDNSGNLPTYAVPIFARTPEIITAGPVVGDFGLDSNRHFVAVGAGDRLYVFDSHDADGDGFGDSLFAPVELAGQALWLSYGGGTFTVAVYDSSMAYLNLSHISPDGVRVPASPLIQNARLYGGARIGDSFVLIAGDSLTTSLYLVEDAANMTVFELDDTFVYGPVVADLNRDDLPEVIVATADGLVRAISVDLSPADPTISELAWTKLSDSVFTNPIVADIDEDGYADVILGGRNQVIGLDRNLISLSDFPITIDRYYPNDIVITAPVVGDIDNDGIKDIVVLTSAGHCYALHGRYNLNEQLLVGFPLAIGGFGVGSPLLFPKSNGGGLAFLGLDGWLYSYDIFYDPESHDWPMAGFDAAGGFDFPVSQLGQVAVFAEDLPAEEFFCYPNPTPDGRTTIRYFVGSDADIVLNIYDMSGKKVDGDIRLSTPAGETGEYLWDGSSLSTGVYRCVLEADFDNGSSESSFTDIAIIK